ncbi:MAG: hypothetical protein HOQ11_16340 [Gemmatimonadaceae bacterium]|nr:hypothetical protein [Gemmatimonadaceae bacterium]NUQ94874.1 hypothetical protein [Gemmatimonadaceae bacterium]NUR21186.1 hypothetical protein [Gemmatimonadaceae bacterium]NUS98971.1 hypothetical protein [Gemmatimonadaceae bacterium]
MRRRDGWTLAVAVLGGALLVPEGAVAQCRPPESSNEAKLLAYYAAPIVFAPQGAPGAVTRRITLGGELTYIPEPDPALQRTGVCFTPKQESTQLSPVFPRPRLELALPLGVLVEASYLPPVKVASAEANLFSGAVSLSRALVETHGAPIVAAARVHVTHGWVRGAITCAKKALQTQDSAAPCYGSAPSRDTFHPNMWGIDGSLGRAFASGRLNLFAGGGATWLAPRFRVGFTSGTGLVDNTLVAVDLRRAAWFTGATWRLLGTWSATGQVYGVPGDVTLGRIGVMGPIR